MTTQKDRIEAAIRHIQTAVDIDPWAMELAVDALKAQGTCEDAVSRQTLQKELALYPIDDVTTEDEVGYNRAINDVQKMVLHLPSAQPQSTMGQVNDTAQSTNDCISRQAAIDQLHQSYNLLDAERRLEDLPSAQPDIIRCRNCKFASGDSRICMKFGHSPIGELDFCAWAERRTDESD